MCFQCVQHTPDGFKICPEPSQKSFKTIDFWNGEYVRNNRKTWMNDEIPKDCQTCWINRMGVNQIHNRKAMSEYIPVNFKYLYFQKG